ncbi:S1 RNA-binding domain-containing protein [Patescibacteria group bacterium]|nr:S1 RNA-binding domain-containing protein [Patescibacteria group bacterium]
MAELIDKVKIKVPKVGELVKGKVLDMGKNALYLDLGIIGTGVVLGREMKDGLGVVDNLRKGDKVEATVIELENEDGYMELSLREAGYEKIWDELKRKKEENEIVSTKILAANRGGLMVEINGITGFLPVSQLSNENYPRVEDGDKNKILQLLSRFVDQTMDVRVIDVNQEEEKLIVSQKATLSEKEEAEIKKFKIGDVIQGTISGIVDFGAFVKFAPTGRKQGETDPKDMLEGLVHISELAWQLIENPRDIIKVGEKVKCKIIGMDNNRISLSIRALKKDPWSAVAGKYKVGDIIKGTVTKFNPFGAFVQLDQDIHGLAHISELNRFSKGRNIEEVLKTGEKYEFKILSIEPKNHRMGLAPLDKKEKTKKTKKTKKNESPNLKSKKNKPVKPVNKKG